MLKLVILCLDKFEGKQVKFTIEIPDEVVRDFIQKVAMGTVITITDGNPTDILSNPARRLDLPQEGFNGKIRISVLHFLMNAENEIYTGTNGTIHTIEDLCLKSREDILEYRNMGDKKVAFLEKALKLQGLKLGMTPSEIQAYREGKFKLES